MTTTEPPAMTGTIAETNGHAPEAVSPVGDTLPGEPAPEPEPVRTCECATSRSPGKQTRFCSRLCAGRAGVGAARREGQQCDNGDRHTPCPPPRHLSSG